MQKLQGFAQAVIRESRLARAVIGKQEGERSENARPQNSHLPQTSKRGLSSARESQNSFMEPSEPVLKTLPCGESQEKGLKKEKRRKRP